MSLPDSIQAPPKTVRPHPPLKKPPLEPLPVPPVGLVPAEDCYVNLTGDYSYLEEGYYVSQDWEWKDRPSHPTCKEALDAYIPPLFLERARLAGLSIPKYFVTNEYFEPPVLIDCVNPFMFRESIVRKPGHVERIARSLTRNYTYAICCQELPEGSRVTKFRAVMGWCVSPKYREAAAALWTVFRLPLAMGRVIVLKDERVLLSGVDVLPFEQLTARELARLRGAVQWPISASS